VHVAQFCVINLTRLELIDVFQRGINPKLPNLAADAEYVANLYSKCQYVVVNVQQCSLLHGYSVCTCTTTFSY